MKKAMPPDVHDGKTPWWIKKRKNVHQDVHGMACGLLSFSLVNWYYHLVTLTVLFFEYN
jgi:hypothetical protein